jgi:flavin-dependent dehydrogenase
VVVHGAGASRLASVAGPDWLAVGDAAMAFDPLSSQGLFQALDTAVTSAAAIERALDDDTLAMTELARSVEPVWAAYLGTARHHYDSERRWADLPFWRNRTHRLAAVS